MNEKLLEIKNLTVEYETDTSTVHAVNDLSLAINKGETFGLVGETGAGKTTTALSIMRLLPDRIGFIRNGSIIFEGEDLVRESEAELRKIRGEKISMIYADPMTSLNPLITIGEQIGEVLELHHPEMTKAQRIERVEEMLTLIGLPPERKDEYPHQFSGGMKQRIVIAIGLACDPELLIADEPTTALDVTIQAQVLEMMNELQRKFNTSIILITHDLGVVAQTCKRVAVMYSGEIIEEGSVEAVFCREMNHPYTTGLFDSIPDLKSTSKWLKPIEGMMPDPTKLPSGCCFHDRCPFCEEKCRVSKPENYYIGQHMIRCHRFAGKGEAR